MSEQLKIMLWHLCHAVLNGDYELAEELAEKYSDQLDDLH